MLFFYFLKKFYKVFFLAFLFLALIFGISDLFIRLPIISSIKITPKLFLLMFPLMSQFAIPLASSFAVQIVIGNLHIEDEVLLLYFFSSARKILHKAILFFSLSIMIVYIPLVFIWVPKSYEMGKEFILKFAKEQFYQLKPNKFYTLVPGFTLFFKQKNYHDKKLNFNKLLLMISEKDGNKYIVNSKNGILEKDYLFLKDGIIQTVDSNKCYFASFKQTEIALNPFFNLEKNNKQQDKQLKFFTWKKLKKIKKYKQSAFLEYYKRFAQVIWQFFFPILAFFTIMIFSRKRSNLLISIFLSGMLFLLYYISLNSIQVLCAHSTFAIFLFYIPLIFLLFVSYFFYFKKR